MAMIVLIRIWATTRSRAKGVVRMAPDDQHDNDGQCFNQELNMISTASMVMICLGFDTGFDWTTWRFKCKSEVYLPRPCWSRHSQKIRTLTDSPLDPLKHTLAKINPLLDEGKALMKRMYAIPWNFFKMKIFSPMTNDDQQLSQMTIMLMRRRRTQMIKKKTMMIRRGMRTQWWSWWRATMMYWWAWAPPSNFTRHCLAATRLAAFKKSLSVTIGVFMSVEWVQTLTTDDDDFATSDIGKFNNINMGFHECRISTNVTIKF